MGQHPCCGKDLELQLAGTLLLDLLMEISCCSAWQVYLSTALFNTYLPTIALALSEALLNR